MLACIISEETVNKVNSVSTPSCSQKCVELQETARVQGVENSAQEALIEKYKATQEAISTEIPEWAAEATRNALMSEIQNEWRETQSVINR